MEWSQKRKIFYALAFAVLVILLAAYPTYRVFNPTPSCFDGRQNGTEAGVDCGGGCNLYCASQIKDLRVVWAKAFMTAPGQYDLGAYVENLNTNAGVKNARYTLRMLDLGGQVLAEGKGSVEIPPSGTLLLFAGNIAAVGIPDKVEVMFDREDMARWIKATPAPLLLSVKNQNLVNADTKPRFNATLVNNDLVEDAGLVNLGAVIYDAARHPVAISKTFVEGVPKGGERNIFFTWPNRFTKNPRGGMCTTPVDTMLVFDRSGSMNVGGKKPPEPLTTAKNAANAYVDAADLADKVGLVSFATIPSSPIDHELSLDHDAVRTTLENIAIESGSLQHTNLGDALKAALVELSSTRHTKDAKRVIVALTDGVANRPLDPTNTQNTSYAETYAGEQATAARTQGVEMYTIGLGENLNETFLRDRIATDAVHYFNAPKASDLQAVYKTISESVCKEEGFITEVVITPRAAFAE